MRPLLICGPQPESLKLDGRELMHWKDGREVDRRLRACRRAILGAVEQQMGNASTEG